VQGPELRRSDLASAWLDVRLGLGSAATVRAACSGRSGRTLGWCGYRACNSACRIDASRCSRPTSRLGGDATVPDLRWPDVG
jgi:hypothetical protein